MGKSKYENSVKIEFIAFLEFLEKATGWKTKELPEPDVFFSENGIDNITNEPVNIYIEKYEKIAFHHNISKNRKNVFISLADKSLKDGQNDDIFSFDEDDIFNDKSRTIIGYEFIERLALKRPELWWLFIASCSENPRIILDKDGEKLLLTADKLPFICSIVNITPSIEIKKISMLSDANKKDFVYDRERSKETYVVMGNGISIPFGSDLWSQLSEYLFDYLQPQYVENGALVKKTIGNSNFSTTSISKTIISPEKYDDALYSCIYRKYEKTMHLKNTLVREIAISKINYPDLHLISYNYDEFLEIEYNNYCNAVSKIKPICNAKEDKNSPEPKILHIHGFMSLDKKIKKGLVLTQEEYYKTYKNDNWVVKTQENALRNNCLYVGSSMSDLFQMSVINRVRELYYKDSGRYFFMRPWRCYALLCLKGLGPRDIATIYSYYLNKGIRIIFTNDFSELPKKYSELFD